MSPPPNNKIALFIDGANLYATAKTLGFDIDYKRLLKEFQSRGTLLRTFYYTTIIEDQEYSSIRPLIDCWTTTATPSSPRRPRSSSTPPAATRSRATWTSSSPGCHGTSRAN
jgi:hypothetical protein